MSVSSGEVISSDEDQVAPVIPHAKPRKLNLVGFHPRAKGCIRFRPLSVMPRARVRYDGVEWKDGDGEGDKNDAGAKWYNEPVETNRNGEIPNLAPIYSDMSSK